MDKDIRLFVLDECHRCEHVKSMLDVSGVDYEIVNITNDDKLISQLIEATKQMEMPILFIGSNVLCGNNITVDSFRSSLKEMKNGNKNK